MKRSSSYYIPLIVGSLLSYSNLALGSGKTFKTLNRALEQKRTGLLSGKKVVKANILYSIMENQNLVCISFFYGTLKVIDRSVHGADGNFEIFRVINEKAIITIDNSIAYKRTDADDTDKVVSKGVQEIQVLRRYKFLYGTIYFSGEGFQTVLSVPATDSARVDLYFSLCRPGSTVTFDRCLYKDLNGKVSALFSKSIKL